MLGNCKKSTSGSLALKDICREGFRDNKWFKRENHRVCRKHRFVRVVERSCWDGLDLSIYCTQVSSGYCLPHTAPGFTEDTTLKQAMSLPGRPENEVRSSMQSFYMLQQVSVAQTPGGRGWKERPPEQEGPCVSCQGTGVEVTTGGPSTDGDVIRLAL